MYYSSIGILASVIIVITNQDILWNLNRGHEIPGQKAYRVFLLCTLAFFITDILWGVLYDYGFIRTVFLDTVLYFVAMAFSVLFWTRFVTGYIEGENLLKKVLIRTGRAFVSLQLLAIAANFIWPILFYFDDGGAYHAGPVRYMTLVIQVVMFLLTAAYSTYVILATEHVSKRRLHAIGLFGLAMAVMITTQVFFPLLPLYSVGCMLGNCLLRTYVIDDERQEYREELEAALKQVRQQQAEIGEARRLAYLDPLTGIRNKLAYAEKENEIDRRIRDGSIGEFAVAVFDLNDLKLINDTMGHDSGDEHLIAACRIICGIFKHSPVFRIGGDEFAAVLEGQDYDNREQLKELFDRKIDENIAAKSVIVSMGISEYIPGYDENCQPVFDRADRQMYMRKQELKEAGLGGR